MEGLWRLEGVNISKGQVRAEGMEQSHVAVENIGEQRRMLRMKFYVTGLYNVSLRHGSKYVIIALPFFVHLSGG